MQDLEARAGKLELEANECDLIAQLAIDPQKRAAFESLGAVLRREAGILRRLIGDMQAGSREPR